MIDNENLYLLSHSNLALLTKYELLMHVSSALFLESKGYRSIVPITVEVDSGVFTQPNSHYPFEVHIQQHAGGISAFCACDSSKQKLCEHSAQTLFCILENEDLRLFFDAPLRQQKLLSFAKAYGWGEADRLDNAFSLSYQDGKIQIKPLLKELLKIDYPVLGESLLPKPKLSPRQSDAQQPILVIGRHRHFDQLYCQLMLAERSIQDTLKNPITPLDSLSQIWKSSDSAAVKFYSAIYALQNRYADKEEELDSNLLNAIALNPLGLSVYLHNRSIAEKISSKSLSPTTLFLTRAEIHLSVFKKEPYFEISGALHFNGEVVPIQELNIFYHTLIAYRNSLHLISNPAVLRVLKFFKRNHELLLIHPAKYDEFVETILAPLEQYVHINYSYIKAASPRQQQEVATGTEALIYIEQEGSYILITPVMRYGMLEVPVYSRKQLFDRDANGNTVKIARDFDAEARLCRLCQLQHADFTEQLQESTYFYLHKNIFFDDNWFLDAFEQWRNNNITIMGFNSLTNNRQNSFRAKIDIQILSGQDWFNAALQVRFGKQLASLKQLHKAIRNKRNFVELTDGSLGILPEEWLQRIAQYFRMFEVDKELFKIPKAAFSTVAALFDKSIVQKEAQASINLLTKNFLKSKKAKQVPVPESLQAELRPYQQEGLNWFVALDAFNFGGCLADDMGLGKTIQVISFMLLLQEKNAAGTQLITVPTSLLSNWQDELQRFSPTLKVLTYHGGKRDKESLNLAAYDVVLTTYGTILADLPIWKHLDFDCIFLDESQAIKNPNSERYKALRLLKARNRFVLTGTPIENNSFDIYAQLSFCNNGLLGSKQYFKDTYATPIDRFGDSKRAQELQAKIAPFVLRRSKQQVAKELPLKTEKVLFCEMGMQQRAIYEKYEEDLRNFIAHSDEDDLKNQRTHVLAGLTKLRQICNSPLLLKDGHDGKDAAKVKLIIEEVKAKAQQHKILIFSQFVGMLDILKAALIQEGIGYAYLTGQSSDRGSIVHNFKTSKEVRVFLISLKAGGVGLNLTEADYVYLVDPWWNPAVENQAIDRIHRIGQDKAVIALRLICKDSVEEKIMHLQQKKRQLAQELIRADQSSLGALSKNELLALLD